MHGIWCIELFDFCLILIMALSTKLSCTIYLVKGITSSRNRLTPVCCILDFGRSFPPDLLPHIPQTVMTHTPGTNTDNGLAHSFSGFPGFFFELYTCRVDDIIPELGSKLKVLFSQLHPLDMCLSFE